MSKQMKKTVVEYVTNRLEEIPMQSLQTNKIRLHAFFSEQETIEKRGTHFVFKYAFYSVEKPRRHTKQSLLKEYDKLCAELNNHQARNLSNMENKEVVLYGDAFSSVAQEQLKDYLQQHNELKVQLTFCDKETSTGKAGEKIAYEELQKALFYCKKKKYMLLFISIRDLIADIHFYDLLEEYQIDFRCVDVPWFCRENLRLIKAVMLYGKLGPETSNK